MATKRQKQWVALVAADFAEHGWKPFVISDDNGGPARFSSVKAIEKLMWAHSLGGAVWQAWNYTTGEVVMIG